MEVRASVGERTAEDSRPYQRSGCDVIASLPDAGLKGAGRVAGWQAYPCRHAFPYLSFTHDGAVDASVVRGADQGRGGGDGHHPDELSGEHAGWLHRQRRNECP